MADVTIDVSEVRAFAAELTRATPSAVRDIKQVTSKGALNIRRQLRGEARESGHFRLERHISYDLEDDGLSAVIGPEDEGAGELGNIGYFGGANGGGGTVPDPRGALDAETPRYLDALSQIVGGFLR